MTTKASDKITADHLRRRAVVYVRQSTARQVTDNLESQRRQYALRDQAREIGFNDVEVIDDDLGRSGSGCVERPGFQRLVAMLCAGEVGAVFSIEASRLARNGRDWHHVIDLCGLVGAVVVDGDGVYDPRLGNDRLLLGLKGSMSEFELGLIRQRSFEAIRNKAGRGELQFALPVGLCWTRDGRIELEPDKRIQDCVRLVFRKFVECGSARQALLWFRREKVVVPTAQHCEFGREIVWKLPVYHTIHKFITNPMYAGAYAFGRTTHRTRLVDGRARKTCGHLKPQDQWTVLIRDHHHGYVSWERFERNQTLLAENAHMKKRMTRKAGRGGRALLAGLLRCRRCGRMLHVAYCGDGGLVPRYHCRGAHINHGEAWCISFGGLRPDQAVAREILRAVEGKAVEAALQAAANATEKQDEQRRSLMLELEEATYQAKLASRRYEAVDPDQRLVTAELEARWNESLEKARAVQARIAQLEKRRAPNPAVDREALLALAAQLPAVWNSPSADMRLKQRIVRILVQEIVADVDDTANEIILVIHWVGGRHSELKVKKNRTGKHSRCTAHDAVEVVRRMGGRWPDENVAATLNRLGFTTGAGNAWTEVRVRTLRQRLGIAMMMEASKRSTLTLEQAAARLAVSATVVRRLIKDKVRPQGHAGHARAPGPRRARAAAHRRGRGA